MSALANWVAQGHTLILIGSNTIPFRYYNDQNIVQDACLETTEPLAGVDFIAATGTRVEYCGPPAAEEIFNSQLSRFRYDGLIKSKEVTPLLRVAAVTAAAPQIVGGYRKLGLGVIFYIPPFQGAVAETKAFFDNIARLPKLIGGTPSVLPDWVSTYQSASEKITSEKISNLEQASAQISLQIAGEKATLESHRALKQLIGGSGSAFAGAVAAALRELDLNVVEGPHPRADLLSVGRTRFIAIEAKGIEGAVREAQFRQTERWTAEVNSTVGLPIEEVRKDPDLNRYAAQLAKLNTPFENISEDCKGLMVIGTYRTTPLADRGEPDFPESVLRLLNRSKVCAITGAQLFTLVMQIRENPALKANIVNELMDTCGVLVRGRDWQTYLEKVG